MSGRRNIFVKKEWAFKDLSPTVVPGQLLGLVLSALMRPLGWAPSHFLPKPLTAAAGPAWLLAGPLYLGPWQFPGCRRGRIRANPEIAPGLSQGPLGKGASGSPVTMRLSSQCALGAGDQRMKHGSPPWRDRRRHGQSLLGLCIQIPAPEEITDHSSVLIPSTLPSPKRH